LNSQSDITSQTLSILQESPPTVYFLDNQLERNETVYRDVLIDVVNLNVFDGTFTLNPVSFAGPTNMAMADIICNQLF